MTLMPMMSILYVPQLHPAATATFTAWFSSAHNFNRNPSTYQNWLVKGTGEDYHSPLWNLCLSIHVNNIKMYHLCSDYSEQAHHPMAAALSSSYGPPQHDSMTKHHVPPQNYSRVAWGSQKRAPSIELASKLAGCIDRSLLWKYGLTRLLPTFNWWQTKLIR